MKEFKYKLQCENCGYDEERTIDIKYYPNQSTGLTCPNCSEGELIVIKNIIEILIFYKKISVFLSNIEKFI